MDENDYEIVTLAQMEPQWFKIGDIRVRLDNICYVDAGVVASGERGIWITHVGGATKFINATQYPEADIFLEYIDSMCANVFNPLDWKGPPNVDSDNP